MRKKISIFTLIMFFMLLISTNTIQAIACPPGHYSEMQSDTSWKCVDFDDNEVPDDVDSNVQVDSRTDGGVGDNIKNLFVNIAVAIGWLSVVIAFFVVIYAGYLYTTSGGKVAQMEDAKRHLIYAFIGMVFGTMTFVIMQLIGGVF